MGLCGCADSVGHWLLDDAVSNKISFSAIILTMLILKDPMETDNNEYSNTTFKMERQEEFNRNYNEWALTSLRDDAVPPMKILIVLVDAHTGLRP